MLAATSEDSSLVPSTHVGQLMAISNSRSMGSDACSQPLSATAHMYTHTHTNTHAHTHFKNKFNIYGNVCIHKKLTELYLKLN